MLKSIFGSQNAFGENVRILEKALRMTCVEVPVARIKLTTTTGSKSHELRPVTGSHNSLALLYWLSKELGQNKFLLDAELLEIAKNFYGNLWNEANHPTIQFLHQPDVEVEVTLNAPQS